MKKEKTYDLNNVCDKKTIKVDFNIAEFPVLFLRPKSRICNHILKNKKNFNIDFGSGSSISIEITKNNYSLLLANGEIKKINLTLPTIFDRNVLIVAYKLLLDKKEQQQDIFVKDFLDYFEVETNVVNYITYMSSLIRLLFSFVEFKNCFLTKENNKTFVKLQEKSFNLLQELGKEFEKEITEFPKCYNQKHLAYAKINYSIPDIIKNNFDNKVYVNLMYEAFRKYKNNDFKLSFLLFLLSRSTRIKANSFDIYLFDFLKRMYLKEEIKEIFDNQNYCRKTIFYKNLNESFNDFIKDGFFSNFSVEKSNDKLKLIVCKPSKLLSKEQEENQNTGQNYDNIEEDIILFELKSRTKFDEETIRYIKKYFDKVKNLNNEGKIGTIINLTKTEEGKRKLLVFAKQEKKLEEKEKKKLELEREKQIIEEKRKQEEREKKEKIKQKQEHLLNELKKIILEKHITLTTIKNTNNIYLLNFVNFVETNNLSLDKGLNFFLPENFLEHRQKVKIKINNVETEIEWFTFYLDYIVPFFDNIENIITFLKENF